LHDYHAKTAPILDLFSRKELVVTVDGTLPPEAVQVQIRQKLHYTA
jgi:adenylate kinase